MLTSTVAILFTSTSLFLSSLTILYWLFYGSFLILDLYNNSLAFYVYLPCVVSLIVFFGTENKVTLSLTRFFLLGLICQLGFAFQQNYDTKTGIFIFVASSGFDIFPKPEQEKNKVKKHGAGNYSYTKFIEKIHEEKKRF